MSTGCDSLFPPPPPAQTGGATVREVCCRSLLNRCSIDDYSLNCYTGCRHACAYCYARFMQRFHPHSEPWGAFVDVKINAPEVLAREVRRMPPGSVFICSACDGWQPVEEHYRLTRRCCGILLDAGFRLNILTKSRLVLRDLDILSGRDVSLGVTITTPDEKQARLWEPFAAPIAGRLDVLRQARAAGIRTAVMLGPLLPGFSDDDASIRRLLSLAGEAGADRIWTDALNPRPRVWPSVATLLRRHRPELLPRYRAILFDPEARNRYTNDLAARINRIASELGLSRRLCGC